MVRVGDLEFKPLFPQQEIEKMVATLGAEISKDFADKNPLFLAVLNGSFIFAADLVRQVQIPCEITFIKVSSYDGVRQTGTVEEILGLDKDIDGRHLIVVEDIVDTGVTISSLLKVLKQFVPASVTVCTLLHKPEAMVKKVDLKYVGAAIPNDFVVGYGLDYNGQGRNLPAIYQLKTDSVA